MQEYRTIKKRIQKPIVFTIEKTKTGFSAFSIDYPIFTTGNSIHELSNNALEAVKLYFEEGAAKWSSSDIAIEIDFKQFFRYYRVLNSKYLAQKIGMNPALLSQYVQGKKKPSAKQTHRILDGIQDIGRELLELRFVEA